MKKILTICIATYNRKNVIVDTVRKYLAVQDERFYIKISDNKSTDGTYEELCKINDERLIVTQNSENLGIIPNWKIAMSDCRSEYLIFTIDKDIIIPEKLTKLITLLSTNQPDFGYATFHTSNDEKVEILPPGKTCMQKLAFLNKHPSGYFYRTSLYNDYSQCDIIKSIRSSYDFYPDILNGILSPIYKGCILHGGYVIMGNHREIEQTKSLSYNEKNNWFSCKNRLEGYRYHLKCIYASELNNKEKMDVVYTNSMSVSHEITVLLKAWMADKDICEHYHLKTRNITKCQMYYNVLKLLFIFNLFSFGHISFVNQLKKSYVILRDSIIIINRK